MTENGPETIVSERAFRSRFGHGMKTISWLLVFAFLVQEAAHAQGGATPVWAHVIQSKKDNNPDELNKIAIPHDSGVARRVVAKGGDELVINIQDAHSKLGAQESISRILDNLVKNYNLNLIALEGAGDVVDTSLLSSFPIEEVRRKTGQFLLSEGHISAGEFYSMISKEPVRLYGAEDPELYRENLETFRRVIDHKLEIRRELKGVKRAILELEAAVYSPALRELSNRKLLHKNGDIKFTEYWEHFSALASANGVDAGKYANLKKLVSTVELEKRSISGKRGSSGAPSSKISARSFRKRSSRSSSCRPCSSSRIKSRPAPSIISFPSSPRA